MKYVVVLGDGMADYHIDSINGTPLEVAKIPNMTALAKDSIVGLVKTVPDGFSVGSDTANLSVLGYDPRKYYSGRSPLEAISLGISMNADDIAIRCNLVTLSDDQNFENKVMIDYSAGEISTAEARVLIEYVNAELGDLRFQFYSGISYRHCLIIRSGVLDNMLTPPHDISGKCIKTYLPMGYYADKFIALYKKANALLSVHPINIDRVAHGKKPANCIWFWGAGTRPNLISFSEKYGKTGAMISAVDLMKGIGKAAQMEVLEVEGATGNYDTNFKNKGLACLKALQTNDFCYVHIEAPDECGHRGEIDKKIFSIEQIDSEIVKTVVDGLNAINEPFALLILPDHPTPIAVKTHVSAPVPYLMYLSSRPLGHAEGYNETVAQNSSTPLAFAPDLMQTFLNLK
ncbi:MAG: cofactor-independent phosphoglycerate mutase [Clostridia bacterium]